MADELTNQQLGFGYWYVTHKLALKRILTVSLIVIDVALVAYVLFLLILNLGIRQPQHDAAIATLLTDGGFASIGAARDTQLPRNIQISGIETLASGAFADIIATLVNPNQKWGATFTYSFALASGTTRARTGFVFPGETKRIYDLNVENGTTVTSVNLSNVTWMRENNFAALYAARISPLAFSDIQYIPAQELQVSDKVPVSRVRFTVGNNTAYNYRDPGFTVILLSGTSIAGISSIFTDQLLSGERKTLEVTWFTRLPRVTTVQVIPEINILDPNVYLKF